MREGEAPSYFNPAEATTLAELLSGLITQTGGAVRPDHLGVMATYRKQVRCHEQVSKLQGMRTRHRLGV